MVTTLKIKQEVKNRIKVALAAYAYEIQDDPIICDSEFDSLCLEINLSIDTGNKEMDEWFKKEFDPCTGQWIHSHPHMDRLEQIYIYMKEIGC